jgi:hypothetical protein
MPEGDAIEGLTAEGEGPVTADGETEGEMPFANNTSTTVSCSLGQS